ncbi:MAG: 23S rRNA (pseudouridine(1915)-N(3))-methyltransferase RlmH [Gemmatimonadaceae bacterium]
MRVVIAAVGRPKEGALAAAIREYEARAARYWPLHIVEVKGERAEHGLSSDVVKGREGERLRRGIAAATTSGALVACDPGGASMTSESFAEWLGGQREAARDVSFVIGGAFGLDDTTRERATMRIALAPWTLSHELARLVLAEQLYRAGTITKGEPYHK